MGLVQSDPQVLWGTPVFAGTKVPAETLFDYIEQGDTLDDFLRDFPSVGRDRAVLALQGARCALVEAEVGPR